MTKKHYPLIRTIYLYIFALLGLVFLIIGAIRFIDMGLKAYVFTKAEQAEKYERYIATPCGLEIKRIEEVQESGELTETEKESLKAWLADYQEQKDVNYVTVRRHQDAAINLSFILVGLPLYLYHWSIIKKETKKKEEEQNKENNN